jgi:predicted ATPase/transcriptional regulator with XRE-family HTH domain
LATVTPEETTGDGSKLASAMENEAEAPGSSAFGTLLRRYRVAAGLSQEILAERARMSREGISALERGFRRTPQRETLALLAGALKLSDTESRDFEAAAMRSVLLRRGSGSSVTVGPWPERATPNLPLALTSFVGRDVELAEIASLVREHRLVTLTGPGGVGKTQTALHVATALYDATDCIVCFAALASIRDASLIGAVIASRLGVQEVPNRPLLEALIAYLKNKNLLLILDNCEHVVEEAATAAAALLSGCPRVSILATSREPLSAAGERAYRLPPLAASDAVGLFADRAQAADAHFVLTERDAPIASEICRRLDCIPLAIELAAARVKVLSVKEMLEKLDDRFRILTKGERGGRRQQTMRATIDWSYELLSASEQRVFERLSVFTGGCTLAAAAAVCASDDVSENEMLDLLSSLVDKSLLVAYVGDESHYGLLESFRQYASERLTARGEDQAVARRHALVCLEWAERCENSHLLPHEGIDNWRAALQWALAERADVPLGQLLAGHAPVDWPWLVELRRWLALAIESSDERTPETVLARLRLSEGSVCKHLMEYTTALSSSRDALMQYRTLGDAAGMARAQMDAGHALLYLGRRAEAKALLQENLTLAREAGAQGALAGTLFSLALTIENDILTVRDYFAEGWQICESIGLNDLAVGTLVDLSECEFCAGNAQLALEYASEALASDTLATRPLKRPIWNCLALTDSSLYLTSLSRYDEAKTCAREALGLAQEYMMGIYGARALERLAAVAILRPTVVAERLPAPYPLSARILGFVDARLAALGSERLYFDRPQYDQILSALRNAMGNDAIANLMMEGALMNEEQVVEQALTV